MQYRQLEVVWKLFELKKYIFIYKRSALLQESFDNNILLYTHVRQYTAYNRPRSRYLYTYVYYFHQSIREYAHIYYYIIIIIIAIHNVCTHSSAVEMKYQLEIYFNISVHAIPLLISFRILFPHTLTAIDGQWKIFYPKRRSKLTLSYKSEFLSHTTYSRVFTRGTRESYCYGVPIPSRLLRTHYIILYTFVSVRSCKSSYFRIVVQKCTINTLTNHLRSSVLKLRFFFFLIINVWIRSRDNFKMEKCIRTCIFTGGSCTEKKIFSSYFWRQTVTYRYRDVRGL